jgi:hypothetical protein
VSRAVSAHPLPDKPGRCRRASQTNDRIGGKGCADTASVQAKDPQGAENEGNRGQCDARQADCGTHIGHDAEKPLIGHQFPSAPPRAPAPLRSAEPKQLASGYFEPQTLTVEA